MKLPLLFAPHPILTAPALEVKRIDRSITLLVHDMETVLASCHDPEGVGLAAPQVGKSLRLFIIRPTPADDMRVFINPHFLAAASSRGKPSKHRHNDMLEGCLSVKNVWSPVDRASVIYISYQNLQGEHKKERFRGFDAHIIQHEVDHLNGILFTQRALEQGKELYRMEQKDGKEEFVPIDL